MIGLERTELVFSDLNASDDRCVALASTLSPPERERAERYHFHPDRRRYVVARARLREALAGRLGVTPAAVPIMERQGGKPVLDGEPGLRFSVSRSGDLAAFAFSPVDVGVDLVSLSAGRFIAALAGDICSPAELAALAVLDPAPRIHALLTIWARKEALLKATGEGLIRTPNWIEVWTRSGADSLQLLHGGRRWQLHDCTAPKGHIVSVVEAGS